MRSNALSSVVNTFGQRDTAPMRTTFAERLLRLPVPTVAAVLIGSAYFVAARGVQNFFPFSVLDMYAGSGARTATRLLAIDQTGSALQVTRFDQWRCDRPLDADKIECPEQGRLDGIEYVNRELVSYIDEHAASGANGESLRLVRRVWRLEDRPGPPAYTDCPVAICTARRR
jgi:hypothetical protein